MGNLATPPPFKTDDWSATASGITISNYRGDEKRRTGYQFRIDHGPWLDSSEWDTLLVESEVQIRPIILGLVYGSPSDIKTVAGSGGGSEEASLFWFLQTWKEVA